MAVTIEKRPIGVTLGAAVSATINSDYSSAFATVNRNAHGLSDGDYVYIKSNIENYNGFFRVDVINANEFLLINNPFVYWVGDADITYYPGTSTHGWSCVHLPIVYELKNTRYPINTIDPVRTISGLFNNNGYLRLSVSASLGTFEDLAFIKINNAPNSNFNGVYQILDKLSTTSIIINFAYATATNTGLVGASIQLYYSNYNAVVRIYAGINGSHEHASVKPYELAATLELIPDSNNKCRFSVNEILKSYVETKNNLLKATLPNNTDFWTNFYISVAEQYDLSNGYTIGTFVSGFAQDTFEGTAANSMLPFKNVHSGYLSDYVMTNSTAKFLTLFAIPVLFGCADDAPDCYQDISIIKELDTDYYIRFKGEFNNSTEIITGKEGVYRIPLPKWCNEDSIEVSIDNNQVVIPPNQWTTFPGNLGFTPPYASVTATSFQTDVAASLRAATQPVNVKNGESITFYVDTFVSFLITQGNAFVLMDDANNEVSNVVNLSSPGFGLTDAVVTLTATADATKLYHGMQVTGTGSGLLTLKNFAQTLSENKTFKVECGCANQEIRLTWLNNLGGFEYWNFTAQREHGIEITDSGETQVNTFQTWPASYGEFADTERKQTYRASRKQDFIFSQLLTKEEAEALSSIKTSPLVQIINSRQDRRTVIVDTDSFIKYVDGDKLYTVQFSITYTDDLPSQTV